MVYGNGATEDIHLRESTEFCCQDFRGVLYCFWEGVEEVDGCKVFATCEADSLGYVGRNDWIIFEQEGYRLL